jgi:hypothetical protein
MLQVVIKYIVFSMLLCTNIQHGLAQTLYSIDSLLYKKGTNKERTIFKNKLIKNINQLVLADTTQKITSSIWSRGLWAMEYLLDSNHTNKQFLTYALHNYFTLSTFIQQQLLETVYTIEPTSFTKEILAIAQKDTVLKHLLICEAYATRNNANIIIPFIEKQKNTNIHLYEAFAFAKANAKQPLSDDQIKKILFNNTGNHYPYIISLQPKHRNTEGVALIKTTNGSFMIDSITKKTIIIPQLARSINALPWYISNGNTPQGVFAITGIGVSGIELIGQTPNLQLSMPNEVAAYKFLHSADSTNTSISLDTMYARFPFLKNNSCLLESYYASKAGRTEIIAHGTTTNPEFYKGKPYYPNTPTMGCLSGAEIYNTTTGKCIQSNQLLLVNSFLKTGFTKGYLLVIDVDDIDYWKAQLR